MTTKEKKQLLLGYKVYLLHEQRILEEIDELRLSQMSAAARIGDGLPRSHDPTDLSSYAARLDDLVARLQRATESCVNARIRIEIAIDSLADYPKEQVLIRMRYIDDYSWLAISKAMGYTVRHVTRIHGSALKHITI